MKLVHGCFLWAVCFYICSMTLKSKVLARRQYSVMLCLTVLVTFMYFAPTLYIAKITYDQQKSTGQGYELFTEWIAMVLKESDFSYWGVLIALILHCQIYMGIFTLQYFTMLIKQAIRQLETLSDNSMGTYSQLELNIVTDNN